MYTIPTELNRRLSDWIRIRIAADHAAIASRAYFWRFVAIGLIGLGLGLAIGIGFYGYSFITRNSDNINILGLTFAKALAEAQLRGTTEGTVRLEPSRLTLATGQTVSLSPDSWILLDRSAKVAVDGELKVQVAPTISAPRAIARPSGGVPAITNFTVFKRVPFDKGAVMTGWVFLTSAQKLPTEEYCYYTENTDTPGVNVVLDLGENRQPELPKSTPKNFDVTAAFENCIWFREGAQ
jgi:hypothetical protein